MTRGCPVEREPNTSLPLQNPPLQFAGCAGLPQTEWVLRRHLTRVVNLSTQALRIFSGVAGLSSLNSAFVLLSPC